jgi:hypothetical protein
MAHPHPHPDGIHYPTDHVVGVLETRAQAEKAAAALRDVGFDADDVTVFHGQEDLATIRKKETFLTAFSRALEPLIEDGGGRDRYLDALANGQSVVLIYTPTQEAVERACGVLTAHDAHNKLAFHRWTIEALPETAADTLKAQR